MLVIKLKSCHCFGWRLNYTPNSFAVNLRTKESKTIGLIIPEVVHHFFQM
jgi:DNA-binding LacI/PurR family transcriptional regulator